MSDNNGWPGKPGVPLNPERDGWHWVKTGHGIAPWRWEENSESIMWDYGWETDDGIISSANFAAMEPCTYLGPCLTSDQATALQARVAELEGVLKGIKEYWNGYDGSAVDAAEECRDRARAALGETQ